MTDDELTSAEKAELAAAREKRIRAEKARLTRMLRKGGIDEERLRGVASIIHRAAFLAVTCDDLQDEINRDGCTDTYQNGQYQSGTKQSPAVQTLAVFAARHFTAVKQLTDLLPDGSSKPKGSDLMDFINRR